MEENQNVKPKILAGKLIRSFSGETHGKWSEQLLTHFDDTKIAGPEVHKEVADYFDDQLGATKFHEKIIACTMKRKPEEQMREFLARLERVKGSLEGTSVKLDGDILGCMIVCALNMNECLQCGHIQGQ